MNTILEHISNLINADNIALLSVLVTVLIFIISRNAEMKYKKRDDIKIQYIKLINLMEDMFTAAQKNKKGELKLTDEMKSNFFNTGASLLMYGSKRIYKLYLLFREFTSNPLIEQCKFYDSKILLHIMSEILVTMRKEVGLSYFNSIENNDALGFFINDIASNPFAKTEAMDAKFRIKMIKFELFIIDRTRFVWIKKLNFTLFKPLVAALSILAKHVLVIPFWKLISKLFPNFVEKVSQNQSERK